MKTVLLLLLTTLAALSHADPNPKVVDSLDRTEPDWGRMVLTVTRAGAADTPYHLSLTVECVDRRTHPNLLHPTVELILDEPLCAYGPHEYNEATTELTLHETSSTSSSGKAIAGPARCLEKDSWRQTFNLRELCEPWR